MKRRSSETSAKRAFRAYKNVVAGDMQPAATWLAELPKISRDYLVFRDTVSYNFDNSSYNVVFKNWRPKLYEEKEDEAPLQDGFSELLRKLFEKIK